MASRRSAIPATPSGSLSLRVPPFSSSPRRMPEKASSAAIRVFIPCVVWYWIRQVSSMTWRAIGPSLAAPTLGIFDG